MAGARTVKILLRGSFPLLSWGNGYDLIKAKLEGAGWAIVAVDLLSRVYYPTALTDVMVTANVFSQYSDNDILNNIKRDLAGTFDAVGASIVSGAAVTRLEDKIINGTDLSRVPDSDILKTLGLDAPTIAGVSLTTMAVLALAGLIILPRLLAPQVRSRY